MTFPYSFKPENERAQPSERLTMGQPGTATGHAPFSEKAFSTFAAHGTFAPSN
jgi:hypothetical protein